MCAAPDLRSSTDFLNLDRHGDTDRWSLPLTPALSGGGGSLFGGAGLAAGIQAIERTTGRPAVWATGQYIARTQPGEVMDLEVTIPSQGYTVSQGRMVGHVGDREIITVLAAVGERPELSRAIWATPVDVPGPEECSPLERSFGEDGDEESMHRHVDVRVARGMFGFVDGGTPSGDERTTIWARMPGVQNDPGALAIMADYGPSALGNALAKQTSCTSIDNTIRFADPAGSDGAWVQLDNQIEFVGNGFAHGTTLMWSQGGRLLAVASQSMIVRSSTS